jgi:hypothetical protein
MTEPEAIRAITERYLTSGDFNGFPVRDLASTDREQRQIATALVKSGKASVNFGDRHPNPHILAFAPEPLGDQLQKLDAGTDLEHACAYPSADHLATVVNREDYESRPFTLSLALGKAQLSYVPFELQVLERYRNDPRYIYWTDDIHGSLSFHDTANLKAREEVLLQSFGFGYDRDITTRVVVVLLHDLGGLSVEQQQLWNLHRLEGDYLPHPGWWASMMGEWPDKVSIFQAFGEELKHINAMTATIGRPPLFHSDYADEKRPKAFGFLIRPTLGEFTSFVHLLDKMMSDNINRAFFKGLVDLEREETRKDGAVIVTQKGTIALLEEWLKAKYRPKDPKPLEDMLSTFRKVRQLRQKPAHAVQDDQFDQEYFREQRQLIIDAYATIRTLRQILANHPQLRNYKVPEWLYKGEIWTR